MNRRIARKLVKQAMNGRQVNQHRLQAAVRLIARRGDKRLDLSPLAETLGVVMDSFDKFLRVLNSLVHDMNDHAARVLDEVSVALASRPVGGSNA